LTLLQAYLYEGVSKHLTLLEPDCIIPKPMRARRQQAETFKLGGERLKFGYREAVRKSHDQWARPAAVIMSFTPMGEPALQFLIKS